MNFKYFRIEVFSHVSVSAVAQDSLRSAENSSLVFFPDTAQTSDGGVPGSIKDHSVGINPSLHG
jgi:hypothetical protein